MRRLIGAASAWGGNPEKDALYLNVTPDQNDGKTVYRLNVRDVPVDGFWSISVYNANGYFEPNKENAYTLNNITATASADGSIAVQFGGCDGKAANCLPIVKGWNLPRPSLSSAFRSIKWNLELPEGAGCKLSSEAAQGPPSMRCGSNAATTELVIPVGEARTKFRIGGKPNHVDWPGRSPDQVRGSS